jgi:dipeptidyl-peptidase III
MTIRSRRLTLAIACALLATACNQEQPSTNAEATTPAAIPAELAPAAPVAANDTFNYEADRFADIRVMRYQIPGFAELSLQQKKLLYFLSQAGMSGRDIFYDQNYRHNLRVRRTIEQIVRHYSGDRSTAQFKAFMTYAKQQWFANGIHHHYSNDKFTPEFSLDYFRHLVRASDGVATWPLTEGQTLDGLLAVLEPVIFDPTVAAKKVNQSADVDNVASSAVNLYRDLTEAEVTAFYANKADPNNSHPVMAGLNSRLVKENGQIVEQVWKVGGLYSAALERVVYWLEQAITVAENDAQRKALELLVKYYRSGDLADFDAYNIAWVADTESTIDVINGFIEVYEDPLGMRGAFESVVSVRDEVATQRITAIAAQAQWFEDNSPIANEHKKANVTGITGKAIMVVSETGDASPATPIGINLPNSDWIRAEHGSKSVSLANITAADNAAPGSSLEEFAASAEEIARAKQWGELSGHLHTDMHEVIGHASGKLNAGIGDPSETLKQYASAMEEGRADLVALYYMMDPKLMELGVMPSLDVGKAEYDNYIRNGLMTQLYRIKPGDNIEEAHMRNRQEIAAWAFEKGQPDNVIEKINRDGKTQFVIHDYDKLRSLFGQLLREHQRIKSEGDFAAAQALIENYGTKVDAALHAEVLARFAKLNLAPYRGFINPKLVPVYNTIGAGAEIIDVTVEYPTDFVEQMLNYAEEYALLPVEN